MCFFPMCLHYELYFQVIRRINSPREHIFLKFCYINFKLYKTMQNEKFAMKSHSFLLRLKRHALIRKLL